MAELLAAIGAIALVCWVALPAAAIISHSAFRRAELKFEREVAAFWRDNL